MPEEGHREEVALLGWLWRDAKRGLVSVGVLKCDGRGFFYRIGVKSKVSGNAVDVSKAEADEVCWVR